MKCEKCRSTVDNRIGLAMNTAITKGKLWCKACFEAAGGKWLYVPVANNENEERLKRERAERYAAVKLYRERRSENEKQALHKKIRTKVRRTTKARKRAALLITKLLRT